MSGYLRCIYESEDTKVQCDSWFNSADGGSMCILHRNPISTHLAAIGINKEEYIEHRDAQAKICYEMTLPEIEEHISKIERVIEIERTNLLTARAVKSDKVNKLTEEERAERRKIKTPKLILEPAVKKNSMKTDPVKYLMEKNGWTEEMAKMMLDL